MPGKGDTQVRSVLSIRRGAGRMRMLVGAGALILLTCITATARADIDMKGALERTSSPRLKSSVGVVSPLSVSSEDGDWRCSDPYSTVANWPYYYAIGNCPSGAALEAVSYASEDPATHEHSYGGFVNGAFSGCGWINTQFPLERQNTNKHTACAEESGGGFKVKESSFWEKVNSGTAQDGYYVVNKTSCPEYANYRPWSENNAPKELIRTVPAYEREGAGERASNPALKWRYVSKYSSVVEPKVRYVMVRDTRIGGGEGNWVFVPRSCLPSTLPTSEGEHLPPAPTVTTGSASGVATPTGTLNATINPNGVETKYYFEYGTTTSYGSYTGTGNAGTGTSGVPVHAEVTGLAAGTTYYFRIVASSAIGESFGGPISFATQPGPTVTTAAATHISEVKSELNGSVDPNGLDTKYSFEYGETRGYGSSTPLADAGSGTSGVPASASIAGLRPGTEYHYRVVATSTAGTSLGADSTFTTLSEQHSDPTWAVRNASTGHQSVYYVGTGHAIWEWAYLSDVGWESYPVGNETDGGEAEAGTSASATVYEGNQVRVYYTGAEHAIWELAWSGSKWSSQRLGGEVEAGTSPSATVYEYSLMRVYYTGKDHAIWELAWNGSEWDDRRLGGEVETGTSPSATPYLSNEMRVYYTGSGHAVCEWGWLGSGWSQQCLSDGDAEAVEPGTSPSASTFLVNQMRVYFTGKDHSLCEWAWLGSEWASRCLGGEEVEVGASPSASAYRAEQMRVYYAGSTSHSLCEWGWDPGWANNCFGGLAPEVKGRPALVLEPYEGDAWVYYKSGGGVVSWEWNGTEWANATL
jgi:hypothetical protein